MAKKTNNPSNRANDSTSKERGVTDWQSVYALLGSVIWIALTFSYTVPLCALILEADGVSTTVTGGITAIWALGMMVASPFVGRFIAAFGARRVMICASILCTVTTLPLPLLDNLYAWFVLRFLYGAGLSALMIVAQAWFSEVVSDEIRGRMVGVFIAVGYSGAAVAPVLLDITGYSGWAPILTVSGVTLLVGIPLFMAREIKTANDEKHSSSMLLKVLRLAPAAVWGAFLLGILEAGVMGLLPIYALRLQYSESAAIILVSVYFSGAILLTLLFGWLVDRINIHTTLIICALATLILGTALPFADSAFIWPIVFLWGGAAVAIYSIGLTIIGQRFRGTEMAAGSAMLVLMLSMGNVIGPFAAGMAMDIWDPYGLFAILVAMSAAYAALVLYRRFAAN